MIYCGIFVALFIISFAINDKSDEYKNRIFKYFTVALTLMSAFRFQVGHDFESYYDIHSIKTWHLGEHDFIEPGYTLISKFCSIIFPDNELSFQLLIAIFAIATMFLYYKVIDKYSKNKVLSLAILFPMYYLNTVFGQIRYGIVLAICIYSFKYIKEKKLLKFLLATAIAFTFHFSAIFFIPIYFFANIELKDIWKIIVLVFSLIFGVVINPVDIIGFINSQFIHSNYLGYKVELYSNSSISIFTSSFIYICLIFIFMYVIYKRSKCKDTNMRIMLNIFFWGIIFYILTNRFEIIAFRVSSYVFILEIILIPNIIYYIKGKYKLLKNIFVAFVIFYSTYRLYVTVFYWIPVFIPMRSYIFHIFNGIFIK